jgi:CTP:molybdopterin cytidylyltransferase MocA
MSESAPVLCGLVLAAGAGSRFGRPKALAASADGEPWVVTAAEVLRDAGCDRVVVVLGAAAEEATALIPGFASSIVAAAWTEGLSASLRAGLAAARHVDGTVVVPVDIPELPLAAVRRIIEAGRGDRRALVQAVYDAVPGHPVFIGADHFDALSAALTGDVGARRYLVAHGVVEIECSDLWSGADIDVEPHLG